MTLSRRTIGLSLAAAAVLAAAAGLTRVGGRVLPAFDVLRDASRPWLTLSVLAFLVAFACTVGAWRAALASAGARLGVRQTGARIATGALVNAFAPAKLGDAVKIALCSRAIDAPDRLWTTGGAYAGLAATRSLTLAALVIIASATQALPVWPVFVLVGCAGVVAAVAAASTRVRHHHRLASLLTGAAALARDPRALLVVCGWSAAAQLARVAGTAAVAVAFGLPHPLLAALVILPALDLAGAIPLTPGSIGVGSGAVVVALASRGIGMTQALAVGLAIQGVETIVSIGCGTTGIVYLLQPGERARRIALGAAAVGASAALGATVVSLI
jgi:uncharacterized membrane protein YbhN (UPF0104 family)